MKARVPWWAFFAGGAVLLGGVVAFTQRKRLVLAGKFLFDAAKTQAFRLTLPARLGQYSSQLLAAAAKYNVSPFALAAVMDEESRGGDALIPRGPGGTGDFIPRKPTVGSVKNLPAGATRSVAQAELAELRRRGLIGLQMFSDMTAVLAAGGTLVLPADGKGWGRGLAQMDFGARYEWVRSHNWADPSVALTEMAKSLRAELDYFSRRPAAGAMVTTGGAKYPDPRPLSGDALTTAAIAAYNAGGGRVLGAIAKGNSPDSVTFRPNYTSLILSKALSFLSAFEKSIGG